MRALLALWAFSWEVADEWKDEGRKPASVREERYWLRLLEMSFSVWGDRKFSSHQDLVSL